MTNGRRKLCQKRVSEIKLRPRHGDWMDSVVRSTCQICRLVTGSVATPRLCSISVLTAGLPLNRAPTNHTRIRPAPNSLDQRVRVCYTPVPGVRLSEIALDRTRPPRAHGVPALAVAARGAWTRGCATSVLVTTKPGARVESGTAVSDGHF